MILGFQGTTLVNYPKQVSSVIFLSDCNFHCPYCYNKSLVYPDRNTQPLSKEYILNELEIRKGFISGVCITGGEPTLYHFDLIKLIEDIKERCPDLLIKLDTNGSRPEVLKSLFERKLIDYVAMDYKTAPDEYSNDMSKYDVGDAIIDSIEIIRNQFKESNNYEFRTTVVRDLFTKKVAKKMARYLEADDKIFLQNFKYFGDGLHINTKTFKDIETAGFGENEIKDIASPIFNKCKQVFLRNF